VRPAACIPALRMPPCWLIAWLVAAAGQSADAQDTALAITGVTVIDGTGATPLPNATVIIERGHVTCVGPPKRCRVPATARRIQGQGRWLIPGLIDAHAHHSETRRAKAVGLLHLAFGVTSVRDMGGYADSLLAWRDRRARGIDIGPRIYLAGHPIDGDPAKWPAEYPRVPRIARTTDDARRLVREARAQGSDFIKLYKGLTTDALLAAVAEAHAQGLRVAADLDTWSLARVDSAVAGGIDSFEHGFPFTELGVETPMSPRRDTSAVAALISRMVAAGTTMTTTLVYIDRFWNAAVPVDAPTFRALPPAMQAESRMWLREANAWWESACAGVRMFIARGGVVMAGTDSYWRNVYPGDVQRELELLVQCGLTPSQALAAATRNPATWLRADSIGTIGVGKVADALLLTANPLTTISNTQRIELVIQGGHVWTQAALLELARKAAR
jgi:imidazolonepropionase-like amidohydrolase